jgi:hypothetical protein
MASTEENGTKRSMVKRFVRWLVVDGASRCSFSLCATLFGMDSG